MTTNYICPACGSNDVVYHTQKDSHQLTLGPIFDFNIASIMCNLCGESTSLSEESDSNFLTAQKQAEKIMVRHLVDELNNKNLSMAYVERVFELPVRTITRWKSGDFSSTALAFLRTMVTFPWIAEVAEKNFSPSAANNAILLEAAKAIGQAVNTIPGGEVSFISIDHGHSLSAVATLTIPIENRKVSMDFIEPLAEMRA